jgi:hypothetical protein
MEFAVLVESVALKIMQADSAGCNRVITGGPGVRNQQISPMLQTQIIQEVELWFDQPHLMIEMFVNYDMDLKVVSELDIFTHLVRSICAVARKIETTNRSSFTGAINANMHMQTLTRDDANIDDEGENAQDLLDTDVYAVHMSSSIYHSEHDKILLKSITSRMVYTEALEQACRIAKTLMDTSGHAFLLMQDSEVRSKSMMGGGWADDTHEDATSDTSNNEEDKGFDDSDEERVSDTRMNSSDRRNMRMSMGVRQKRAVRADVNAALLQAVEI